MKHILLIHGPNLNKLGQRDPEYYGHLTLEKLETIVSEAAQEKGAEVTAFQSNHEGAIIDFIQEHSTEADAIIINPGAFTHYSYALHDALLDAQLPAIEVHLSDVEKREEFRKISVTAPACIAKISGKKEQGYIDAVTRLFEVLSNSGQL